MDRRAFILAAGAASLIPAIEVTAGQESLNTSLADAFQIDDPKLLTSRLEQEARQIFADNRVESSWGLFHLPSAATYRSFFAWDSGWNIISLAGLDPEAALSELKTVFSVQADDGHVPHEVRVSELSEQDPVRKLVIYLVRRQYDESGRSCFIDPPSFLIAAQVLYERSKDPRIFELLPAMERCVKYLVEDRDLFGDGLVSIIHPWESGTDSAPVFDEPIGANVKSPMFALEYAAKYPRMLNSLARLDWDLHKIAAKNAFVFEDVGMNAITAGGISALGDLCMQAHLEGFAGGDAGVEEDYYWSRAYKYHNLAKDMVAAMEEILWDDSAGFFYPRYDLKLKKRSRRTCLTGLLPLITGAVSEDKAHRVIDDYLCSEKHFNNQWLVPFNSMSELEGEKLPFEDLMLWRGHCIWGNMNWLAARAAALYGREDLARKITRNTAVMVGREGFREFYDYRTGKGGGAPGFTWPALVLDMIERYGI